MGHVVYIGEDCSEDAVYMCKQFSATEQGRGLLRETFNAILK